MLRISYGLIKKRKTRGEKNRLAPYEKALAAAAAAAGRKEGRVLAESRPRPGLGSALLCQLV